MTTLHQRIVACGMYDAMPRRLLREDRSPRGLVVSAIGLLCVLAFAAAVIAVAVL